MAQMTIEQAMGVALEHHRAGRLPEAEGIYRQILTTEPKNVSALSSLAVLAAQVGKPDVAVELLKKAAEIEPGNAATWANLGECMRRAGRLEEAIEACRRAVAIRGDFAEAYGNLGAVLNAAGRAREAMESCRKAVRLKPDFAEAWNGLGNACSTVGEVEEAIRAYREALRVRPGFPEAMNNLGVLLKGGGEASMRLFRGAIEADPGLADGHNNLGNALREAGQIEEAMRSYQRAMELAPANPRYASNRLYAMYFDGRCAGEEILWEHVAWGDKFAEPLKGEILPHDNERSPGRRLRVGYVSPDFREHALACFLMPLLENHRASEVEVFCYSGVPMEDHVTKRIKGAAHGWRDIGGMTDEQVTRRIREDRMDVLVDLALHMAGGRPLVFARKPAPVQVTWLGYAGTTGLKAVDHRLTDGFLDPEGERAFYTEESVRLKSYWCYQPQVGMPEVNALPAAMTGQVTFGNFNSSAKASVNAIGAWAKILAAVPGSRMVIYCPTGEHREKVWQQFMAAGVAKERVTLTGMLPLKEYHRQYLAVDVALDPFPYCGGTTTCDALHMGVPVVTLAGRTAVGRGGVSLLSHVGLPELIATSEDQYVRIAVELAGDLGRLAKIRSELRERMKKSVIMDGKSFAADIEKTYRGMWERWCAGGK